MEARDLARKLMRRGGQASNPPKLSFGSWDDFPGQDDQVVQICHPDWRGVRTAAYAFRSPVVECDDLDVWGESLLSGIRSAGIGIVVVQGWPPGAPSFVRAADSAGIRVKCVLHSSPAQHGAEAAEAAVADDVLGLAASGVLAEVGMVKKGLGEAFRAAGHAVTHVPNRAPQLPTLERIDLGPGLHVGVFAESFWRKNVVTQLLAVGLLDDAVGHVMRKPLVHYLSGIRMVEHGDLPWERFMAIQASVDLNLYVTLSECHPLLPIESYLLGVPCLLSRTSGLFREDGELWDLTTVDRLDEPTAIAEAAHSLLARKEEAVVRARTWIAAADLKAKQTWEEFVTHGDASASASRR